MAILPQSEQSGIIARLLNNRPLKSKISIIVTPLVVIALYGMAFELYSAYKRFDRAKELERANAASDFILKAAGEQAKERGFTASVLANPSDQKTLAAISNLRKKGDSYLDSSLALIQDVAKAKPNVAKKYEVMLQTRTKRDSLRKVNDTFLGQSSPTPLAIKQWIGAQSAMIMAEHSLAESMFLGESSIENILALNSSIKNSVFYASEFAGRERANIGTAIGSGKSIDVERYASLMQFRGIVQEHCDNILAFSNNPAVTPTIKTSIDDMKRVFLTEFEETRKAMYKASADSLGKERANYPIQTSEWIKRSTNGINTILKVSNTVSEEVARLSAEERRASFVSAIFTLIIFLILLVVILLSNKIIALVVGRITKLRNTAQEVERGNLAMRTNDATNDEIGELSSSLNAMIASIERGIDDLETEKASVEQKVELATKEIREQQEYLQTSVYEMLKAVQAFSEGDLTQRLSEQRNGEIGKLFTGYNQALEKVRGMISKIVEETEHTASASTEITVSIEHMAHGIQRQHEQANYIAISTEEMSKTIEETAKNTTLIAKQSQEASEEATLGGSSLQKMIDAVNSVNEIVTHSAESVQHLNDSSEQISAISASIAEIADQTNLLALNAAIEAARAGEQGRGFAVVADEVRKLAERTQVATKEISQMITSIQKDTHNVVTTMKRGVTEVEQARGLVQQTYDSLERIIARTKGISDFITQLAVTSEEQHATSEDIASNMGVMTMIVSQSASVSEQIAHTSQQLNQMTIAVQNLVQTFRVEEEQGILRSPEALRLDK